jgi:hypothetical protein
MLPPAATRNEDEETEGGQHDAAGAVKGVSNMS